MNGRHLVFVLGMHRSGTSAMTRVLSEFGDLTLPPNLLGASYSNRWGHWEPQESLALNDRFLAQFGSAAFDPGFEVQLGSIVSPGQASAFQDQIAGFLTELFQTSRSIVVKDPRISVVLPYWIQAAQQAGCRTSAVFMFRHPAHVAASLFDRDRISAEYGAALWLKYNLICERESRGLRRVFVEFDALQEDWRGVLTRVNETLALGGTLDERKASFIDGFLDREARRPAPVPFAETVTSRWMKTVYEWLQKAERDPRHDPAVLNQCLADVADVAATYRESYRDYFARFEPAIDAKALQEELTQLGEQMSLCEDILVGKQPVRDRFSRIRERMRTASAEGTASIPRTFDPIGYVTRYRDLFDAEVDPYRHYVSYGAAEGRRWESPADLLRASEVLRSAKDTLARYGALLQGEPRALQAFEKILVKIRTSGRMESGVPADFNPVRYAVRYPDLFYGEVDPYEHFRRHGAAEGRTWDFDQVD